MSDANIEWHQGNGMPALPGEEHFFTFTCPRRGRRCEGIGSAEWEWDGPHAAPTFTAPIHCGYCGWEGLIHTGRCKRLDGNDEPEPRE